MATKLRLMKFLEEVRRPIGAVHLQAVTENGMKRRVADGLQLVQRPVSGSAQKQIHRLAAKVVENIPFHPQRGPLHLLAGGAVHEDHDAPIPGRDLPALDSEAGHVSVVDAFPGSVGEHD